MVDGPPNDPGPDSSGPDHDVCDVIVIGAGPAGISAAIHLHWLGLSVQVYDKAQFPRDKCCGDGLTTLALRELERLQFHPRAVPSWQPLNGAILIGPDRSSVSIPLPPPTSGRFGAVAPRMEFDNALVQHGRAIGLPIFEHTEVTAVQQEREMVRATLSPVGDSATPRPPRTDAARTVTARYLVAADGAWSPVRRLVGARAEGYRGDWNAMRTYVEGVSGRAATEMLIWFEPDLLPGYVWSFPLPDGRANFGFGVLRDQGRTGAQVAHIWSTLFDRPHIRAEFGADAHPVGRHMAWPIPARIDEVSASDHRVIFVGDAVAASDVLTGEGIGQALLTGRLAAESIRRGGSDSAASVTSEYRRRLRRELYPDHRMSQRLASMMSTPAGAQRALSIIARSGEWGRRNFARWLFEDEPRGILLTPLRWHRRFLSRSGAYRSTTTSATP